MPDDARDMAKELEGLLASGGLDPGALLAGEWRFHSVFIAPFTPSFAEARQRFLADGGGPLAGTVEQLRNQGLAPAEALPAAQRLMAAAQGLCVAVVAGDHGVASMPQPFFGHFDPRWLEGASQVLGAKFHDGLANALASLAAAPAAWPRAVAGPARHGDDLHAYWLELGHGCASAMESVGAGTDQRLGDLGSWVVAALVELGADGLDSEDHAVIARCALAAGILPVACQSLAACAAAGGEDAVVELFDALATTTCRLGGDLATETWLAGTGAEIGSTLGCAYDAALARLRITAAAGAGEDRLRPAADALVAANRKLARQALTREPLWQVLAAEPGEVVDTAGAADLIGRSPAFVSKRLEARTIPFHVRDGQLRLPRTALLAWKTVLDAHQALD
jgi:hypothetical protein